MKSSLPNLAVIRKEKKFTYYRLAQIIRHDQGYVKKIETGKVDPGIRVVLQIAEALGVTVNDLVYEVPPEPIDGKVKLSKDIQGILKKSLNQIDLIIKKGG
jgi:transcriptional regulator with XRE-family HTH domain